MFRFSVSKNVTVSASTSSVWQSLSITSRRKLMLSILAGVRHWGQSRLAAFGELAADSRR
jgi:hypothetical protein